MERNWDWEMCQCCYGEGGHHDGEGEWRECQVCDGQGGWQLDYEPVKANNAETGD